MVYLFIFTLSGIAALLRYWISAAANTPSFPWGTFSVNVIGSVALGVLLYYGSQKQYLISKDLHIAVGVGLLGGLTTFSTFSMELVSMIQDGRFLVAGGYVLGSLVASLCFIFLSYVFLQRAFT